MNRTAHVPGSILTALPRQRGSVATSTSAAAGQVDAGSAGEAIARGVRGWASSIWRRYSGRSVVADPLLTTVWIHGQCLDVSIYDRDWPESYRY